MRQWGGEAVGTQWGPAQPCAAAMLSQVAADRALPGAGTRRQFWCLIKQVDVLCVLVICDVGFLIFHDSINFLLQRMGGGEQEGKAWIKSSFILPFFGQSGLRFFLS